MTKSEIKQFYNIDKIIKASELAKLSKTYRDNNNTIIVMMKRKPKKPNDPPAWFISYKSWSEGVFNQILERLTSIEDILTRNKIDGILERNNLR